MRSSLSPFGAVSASTCRGGGGGPAASEKVAPLGTSFGPNQVPQLAFRLDFGGFSGFQLLVAASHSPPPDQLSIKHSMQNPAAPAPSLRCLFVIHASYAFCNKNTCAWVTDHKQVETHRSQEAVLVLRLLEAGFPLRPQLWVWHGQIILSAGGVAKTCLGDVEPKSLRKFSAKLLAAKVRAMWTPAAYGGSDSCMAGNRSGRG